MTPKPKRHEFEGATVEEAIDKAVEALNVSRETLKIKIVCEAEQGLFGMRGASPAKIRVTLEEKKV